MNSYSLFLFSQKPTPHRYDPVAERQLLPLRVQVACLDRLKKKAFLADWEAAMQPGLNAGQQTRD